MNLLLINNISIVNTVVDNSNKYEYYNSFFCQQCQVQSNSYTIFNFFFKAVLKILNKPNSVMDWGTYASNAVVSGYSNGLLNMMDNYDKVKEFFAINLDAFIVAASLKHFGMETVASSPTNNTIPDNIRKGCALDKRTWLHNQVSIMLDKYVMDNVSCDLQDIQTEFASPPPSKPEYSCHFPPCTKKYKYVKCLLKHEQKEHGMEQPLSDQKGYHSSNTTDNQEESKLTDDKYDYGTLTLSLGLLLRNADDAVKEGDGERLCRVWKFLTFLYRATGNTKYALAGLRLTACQLGLLTPRKAHQLKWNRFAASKCGPGKRKSRDLRLENNSLVAKNHIKALGFPNINPESIMKTTKSTGNMEKLLNKTLDELQLTKRSTKNSNKSRQDVFNRVLNQVHVQAAIFNNTPGRQFDSFTPAGPIFKQIDRKQLHTWIKRHKKKWHNQNRNFYTMNI